MLCSSAMQKGLVTNAFQTSAVLCLSLSWDSFAPACQSVVLYCVLLCLEN